MHIHAQSVVEQMKRRLWSHDLLSDGLPRAFRLVSWIITSRDEGFGVELDGVGFCSLSGIQFPTVSLPTTVLAWSRISSNWSRDNISSRQAGPALRTGHFEAQVAPVR